MGIFKTLSAVARNRTTYRAGLLQAKAYRVLKQRTGKILAPFGISTIEWGFLGLLMDSTRMRARALADELGVEPPFVTVMAAKLEKKGLVAMQKNTEDKRAKTFYLTPRGKTFVEEVEKTVRAEIRPLVAGINPAAFIGYFQVLEKIVENSREKHDRSSL